MWNESKYAWQFFVAQCGALPDSSCRISALHFEVFHGQGRHPVAERTEVEINGSWFNPIPAASNNYRERLHITRSGTYIPDIFCPDGKLVMSEVAYRKISSIDNIIGEEVIFDKLVDLPMPMLGDMSYYEQKRPYKKKIQIRGTSMNT